MSPIPELVMGMVMAMAGDVARGEVVELSGDWIVSGKEAIRDTHIRLDGSLVLPEGSELTLVNCQLEIVGGYSREHSVEWKGGALFTRDCTIGGFVDDNGIAIHTVFHLYEGHWEAVDTIVQYSYGISFHWKAGRGVLRGTRLIAGPRPDAIILSGEADVKLVDSEFPVGLGVYVDQGGKTVLDLDTHEAVTRVYDRASLLPGVNWRLEMVNTKVKRWFVFVRNIGMQNDPAEVVLKNSRDLILSILGHNLTGSLDLSTDLTTPMTLGNVTVKNAGEPAGISMFALYFSGDRTDLSVSGKSHICELMHRGGKLKISGPPGEKAISIGCTTLELSGNAALQVHNVHMGRPLSWQTEKSIGEATVAGKARLWGSNISVRNVRFHTKDEGFVSLSNVQQFGTIESRQEGGDVLIQVTNSIP